MSELDGLTIAELAERLRSKQLAPVEVAATGGQKSHPAELAGTDILDTVAATFRFADGSVSTFLISDADFNGFASKWMFEIYGSGESAVLYEHAKTVAFGVPGDKPSVETLSPQKNGRLLRQITR